MTKITKPKITKPKIEPSVIITGIICLAALEAYALSQGINGTLFTIVAALIGAAIGVAIPLNAKK